MATVAIDKHENDSYRMPAHFARSSSNFSAVVPSATPALKTSPGPSAPPSPPPELPGGCSAQRGDDDEVEVRSASPSSNACFRAPSVCAERYEEFLAAKLAETRATLLAGHEAEVGKLSVELRRELRQKEIELDRLQAENQNLRATLGIGHSLGGGVFGCCEQSNLLTASNGNADGDDNEVAWWSSIHEVEACAAEIEEGDMVTLAPTEPKGKTPLLKRADCRTFDSILPQKSIQLLDEWVRTSKKQRSLPEVKHGARSTMSALPFAIEDVDEIGVHTKVATGPWRLFMIHPSSMLRCTWDTLSVLLVSFDTFNIPIQLLDPPANSFVEAMVWVTRLFWTLDMFMSFLSGLTLSDGFIEMRPARIARIYLKSWFALDTTIVCADWADFFIGMSSEGLAYARMGKASRAFRIVRMLRLLRMLHLWQIIASYAERFRSEKLSIIAHMAKLMIFILGWSHVTACVWYGIGTQAEARYSWLSQHGVGHTSLMNRYLSALHWGLSQFTGGMDEFTPGREAERWFAIFMFIAAFILAAAFTSTLTSSLTRLQIITGGHSQQLSVLRRYLAQYGISNGLSIRIQRNVQRSVAARYIPEHSVELMVHVSEPLKCELDYEIYMPVLNSHPFFFRYGGDYPHVARQICHYSTFALNLSSGDVVFSAGEVPERPKMYLVRTGEVQYVHVDGHFDVLKEGQWISEAALWVHWMHRGTLEVSSVQCQLLQVDAASFAGIVTRFEHIVFDPWTYAEQFLEAIDEAAQSGEEFLDVMQEEATFEIVEKAAALSRAARPRNMRKKISRIVVGG